MTTLLPKDSTSKCQLLASALPAPASSRRSSYWGLKFNLWIWKGHISMFFLQIFPKSPTRWFLHLVGQNCLPWPCLGASVIRWLNLSGCIPLPPTNWGYSKGHWEWILSRQLKANTTTYITSTNEITVSYSQRTIPNANWIVMSYWKGIFVHIDN